MGKRKKTVPKDETKKDKFKRVVTPRVQSALKSMSLICNCATKQYEYTDDEVQTILLALQNGVDGIATAFTKGGKTDSGFKL